METLFYNAAINSQYDYIEKACPVMRSWMPDFLIRESTHNKRTKKFRDLFVSQCFQAKGLYTSIQERFNDIKGKDLSEAIDIANKLIALLIKCHTSAEEIPVEQVNEDIAIGKEAIKATIEDLYEALTLLKKANKRYPKEPSALAIGSTEVAKRTLETVFNEH